MTKAIKQGKRRPARVRKRPLARTPKPPSKTKDGLTGLQLAFVNEYAANGFRNQTAAYQRAQGYEGNYSAATVSAGRLLKRPAIVARVEQLKKRQDNAFAVGLDEITREVYELTQINLGRKAVPRLGSINGLPIAGGNIAALDATNAVRSLELLAKMKGGLNKEAGADRVTVNLAIDIGLPNANPVRVNTDSEVKPPIDVHATPAVVDRD